MKKFIFSALAYVAFAGSGFASNEIVNSSNETLNQVENENLFSQTKVEEDFIPCSVSVTYTYNGRYYTQTAHADVADGSGCSDFLSMIEGSLTSKGYRINGRIAVSGAYDRTLTP